MDDIDLYLKEDLNEKGDITTDAIMGDEEGMACIISKDNCILAGGEEAVEIFSRLGCKAEMIRKDGEAVKIGRAHV